MDLPVKFPSETDVILEDVARFRALSPEEQMRSFRGFIASVAHIARISPKADWARQYTEEQEMLAQRNIREFLARQSVSSLRVFHLLKGACRRLWRTASFALR